MRAEDDRPGEAGAEREVPAAPEERAELRVRRSEAPRIGRPSASPRIGTPSAPPRPSWPGAPPRPSRPGVGPGAGRPSAPLRPAGAGAGPMIVVGASTGGVYALEQLLRALPPDAPPVLIVQHMPAGFTRRFADRCDELCAVTVKEAEDGDEPRPGLALVAAGNHHLRLVSAGRRLRVSLDQEPRVSGHRPSVDVLFESAARLLGPRAVGVLLTGMGRDGAAGLLQMKRAGARTIAQDEATCVVFGMPEAAISLGAVDWVLPMGAIATRALEASATI